VPRRNPAGRLRRHRQCRQLERHLCRLSLGANFAEPFGKTDISKSIVNLAHVSGYKYGTNFFNADLLMSDSKDPSAPGSKSGAQEIYIVYRHTLDLGKVTGSDFKFGPIRGFGLTGGFDVNTKNDAGYNSKKRMIVAGPTMMMDVPASST
jgi:nucleoside-specific outer membrane channel protein Tsx